MSSRKVILAALLGLLLAPASGLAQFTNNCVLKATSSSVYSTGCGTATDNGTTFAVGEALTATSATFSSLTSGNPVCATTGGLLSTTNSCGIATLSGTQTFTAPVTFDSTGTTFSPGNPINANGGAEFIGGSLGVNAVGFYVSGTTLFSIASAATFVMAPTNGTATSSNNYGSTVAGYENAYWQGSASTLGAFLANSTPATGSNPLITLNHVFNANYGLGTGGTGTGQEYWAYPIGSSSYYSVATGPTGSCSRNGDWVFSQDGHATVCLSGTWSVKI